MSADVNMELIYQLVGYPDETEWLEFKQNDNNAEKIGKDIAALANSAAFREKPYAYKIWGVADKTHELLGTRFNPLREKAQGNQDLPMWLKQHLSANANYQFHEINAEDGGLRFVVLRIAAASYQPVRFNNQTYIREGSSTTSIGIGSEKEAELWRRLQRMPFEKGIAEEDLSFSEVEDRLDIDRYFELVGIRRPSDDKTTCEALARQGVLIMQDNGDLAITNGGALLIARDLGSFSLLRKRRLRVISFRGEGRSEILEDAIFDEGYAMSIPLAQERIQEIVPTEDVLEGAFRKVRSLFPERAVRELLSNAVIHQNLHDASRAPEVHVFSNRIEFANPGAMLVPANRVLNAQPVTRNNMLVNALRQMDLCEEGGTGWDIVIEACEARHMLAPQVKSSDEDGTQVVLYAGNAFSRMTKEERRRAAYWHSCLMLSQDSALTNTSLRKRFGLDDEKKSLVAMSRLIRECCDEGSLKEEDPDAGKRHMRYVPFWA